MADNEAVNWRQLTVLLEELRMVDLAGRLPAEHASAVRKQITMALEAARDSGAIILGDFDLGKPDFEVVGFVSRTVPVYEQPYLEQRNSLWINALNGSYGGAKAYDGLLNKRAHANRRYTIGDCLVACRRGTLSQLVLGLDEKRLMMRELSGLESVALGGPVGTETDLSTAFPAWGPESPMCQLDPANFELGSRADGWRQLDDNEQNQKLFDGYRPKNVTQLLNVLQQAGITTWHGVLQYAYIFGLKQLLPIRGLSRAGLRLLLVGLMRLRQQGA